LKHFSNPKFFYFPTCRGEKLYVTKDSRVKSQKNKLCWLVCIGLVAAVIILGILAACKIEINNISSNSVETLKLFSTAGAFNKSESPVEARGLKSDKNETVASAGIFGGSSESKKQSDSTTTTSTTIKPTLPPIIPSSAVPAMDKNNFGENFPFLNAIQLAADLVKKTQRSYN
jgi:hypothetical protein